MSKHKTHRENYDFPALATTHPELEDYMFHNAHGNLSINFANPKAVKALNTALLKHDYGISYWEFPDAHLCPPIPGRAAYIHLLHELLSKSGLVNNCQILDIGTGATCIYPLLGHAMYNWRFVATEIDKKAIQNAKDIIAKNAIQDYIELRFQGDKQSVLTGIINPTDTFSAAMCNPPFYKSELDAVESTKRKQKGLGQDIKTVQRNFSGTANELWYPGGEKAFLHNYLYQSSLYKTNCFWYTSLVSKKELLKSMKQSLTKLGASRIEVLELQIGNKISRVVAWSFLNEKQMQSWIKIK